MGDVGNYRNLFHTACQRAAACSPRVAAWETAWCERPSAAASSRPTWPPTRHHRYAAPSRARASRAVRLGPASASGGHPTAAATAGRTRASGGHRRDAAVQAGAAWRSASTNSVPPEDPLVPAIRLPAPAEGGDRGPAPGTPDQAPALELGPATLGDPLGYKRAVVQDRGPGRLFVVKVNPSLGRACVLLLVRFPCPGECLSCHRLPRPIVVVLCGGVAAGRAQAA